MVLCDPARMKKARALRMIRRLKIAGPELSDWEGEFLDSVEGRVQAYGRAFADPEKGGRDSALSVLQSRKLKEITVKTKAKAAAPEAPSDTASEAPDEGEGRAPKSAPTRRGGLKSGGWRRKPFVATRH